MILDTLPNGADTAYFVKFIADSLIPDITYVYDLAFDGSKSINLKIKALAPDYHVCYGAICYDFPIFYASMDELEKKFLSKWEKEFRRRKSKSKFFIWIFG